MTKRMFLFQLIVAVIACLVLPLLLAWEAVGCPQDCEPHGDVCACSEAPQEDKMSSIRPSDEKPPRSGMPSYQAEGIKAAMPDSQIQEVQHEIDEERDADAIGKKRAGL
jgi:hypothetical protein